MEIPMIQDPPGPQTHFDARHRAAGGTKKQLFVVLNAMRTTQEQTEIELGI